MLDGWNVHSYVTNPSSNPQGASSYYYLLAKHYEIKSTKGVGPMLKDLTKWDHYVKVEKMENNEKKLIRVDRVVGMLRNVFQRHSRGNGEKCKFFS